MTTENTKVDDKKNIIIKIMSEKAGFGFKPNRQFYDSIEINQKRFGMLCKKKISPTLDEITAICKYFNADISQFLK